tara:strand:- start:527 stop:907 length:381 start_codon:yes stop_codon:yes gene_type:complete
MIKSLEKLFRSRLFWLVGMPVLVSIVIVLVTGVTDTWYFIIGIGAPLFHMGILKAIGFPIDVNKLTYFNALTLIPFFIFYGLFTYFIVRLKKLNPRILKLISIIFIVSAILGIRGCTQMVQNIRIS